MNSKRTLRALSLTLILALILSFASFAADLPEKTPEELYEQYLEIKDLYHVTNIDPSPVDEHFDAFMKKLLEKYPDKYAEMMDLYLGATDPYGGYFTQQEYKEAYGFSGRLVGIGVKIAVKNEFIVIDELYNGPAAAAGMKVGDKLVAVDGVDTKWAGIDEIGELIRGEEGTSVQITVLRPGVQSELVFTLERGRVQLPAVSIEMIEDDKIGYIEISAFDDYFTYVDFYYAMKKCYNWNVDGIIVDVRNNPGGDLDALVNIINVLCKDGEQPFFTIKRANEEQEVYGNGFFIPYKKLVVLANENSYSAAEIFAGVVKDLKLGTVVGKTTHGKGVGQTHSGMPDGGVAVTTTMDILLPKSGRYDGVGVTPDVEIGNQAVKRTLPELPPMRYTTDLYEGMGGEAVLGVETYLKVLGYYDGEPNLYFDKRSENALKRFEAAMGLTPNGVITSKIVDRLFAEMENLRNTPEIEDTQLKKAIALLS